MRVIETVHTAIGIGVRKICSECSGSIVPACRQLLLIVAAVTLPCPPCIEYTFHHWDIKALIAQL